MTRPLLTIVVPHMDAKLSRLLFLLLWQCQQQKLWDTELIVVNTTGRSLADSHTADETSDWLSSVQEIAGPAGLTYGAVCNIGLRAATGEFVCCLDPEAYLHPDRLLAQVTCALRSRRPAALRGQSLVDVSACTAPAVDTTKAVSVDLFLREEELGVAETLVFPRTTTAGDPWLFDITIERNGFAELWARLYQHYRLIDVLDNTRSHSANARTHGWTFLSTGFYHGQNRLSATDFFRDTKRVDVVRTPGVMQNLSALLRMYGFQVV